MRLLLVSSSGGHWIQASRLLPVVCIAEVHIACTQSLNLDQLRDRFGVTSFSLISDFNIRSAQKLIGSLFEFVKLIRRIKPTHIITTGAAPGVSAILVGRILGCRTLWIDSIANSKRLSMSGAVSKYIAHHTWSQWEDVAIASGCEYKGRVF